MGKFSELVECKAVLEEWEWFLVVFFNENSAWEASISRWIAEFQRNFKFWGYLGIENSGLGLNGIKKIGKSPH